MVPSSSIIRSNSSGEASPILSQMPFICSSISKSQAKADFNTSRIVMPFSRTVCWSRYPTRTFFAHSIFPSSGISFPVIIFINVDFPSPLAPTRPICSPFSRRKDTSWKIARSPKPWERFCTFNILIFSSPYSLM